MQNPHVHFSVEGVDADGATLPGISRAHGSIGSNA